MEVPKKEAERPPRGVKWKGKKDPGKEPPPPPPQQLPLTDQSNLQRKVPRPQPRSAVLVLEATDEELEDFGLQRIVAGAAGDAGGAKRKREEEQEEEEETTTTSPSLRLTGQKKRKKKQPLRRARKGDGDVGFSAAECYSSLAQSCPGGIGDVVRFRRPGLVPERPSLSRAGPVPDPFAALSDEVLLQVFRWLSRHSLSRAARCCRRFRLLAQDETLWRAVDVGGRSHLPPGAVGVLLARGARALRAARANLLAPVLSGLLPAAPTWETCKLTALDLSGASIAPGELEEVRHIKKKICRCAVNLHEFYPYVPCCTCIFSVAVLLPPTPEAVHGEPAGDGARPDGGPGQERPPGDPAPGHGHWHHQEGALGGPARLPGEPEAAEPGLDEPVQRHPGGAGPGLPLPEAGEAEHLRLQGHPGGSSRGGHHVKVGRHFI